MQLLTGVFCLADHTDTAKFKATIETLATVQQWRFSPDYPVLVSAVLITDAGTAYPVALHCVDREDFVQLRAALPPATAHRAATADPQPVLGVDVVQDDFNRGALALLLTLVQTLLDKKITSEDALETRRNANLAVVDRLAAEQHVDQLKGLVGGLSLADSLLPRLSKENTAG